MASEIASYWREAVLSRCLRYTGCPVPHLRSATAASRSTVCTCGGVVHQAAGNRAYLPPYVHDAMPLSYEDAWRGNYMHGALYHITPTNTPTSQQDQDRHAFIWTLHLFFAAKSKRFDSTHFQQPVQSTKSRHCLPQFSMSGPFRTSPLYEKWRGGIRKTG